MSALASSTLSGLALKIASATSNEVFDLANLPSASISSALKAAFAKPFDLSEVIRITLVVGGGKVCLWTLFFLRL